MMSVMTSGQISLLAVLALAAGPAQIHRPTDPPGIVDSKSGGPGDDPIRVILPRSVDVRSCQLHYLLVGPFGGYGGFVQPAVGASELEIETVHEGAAVERLSAYIYCSGYQLETIAFDSLPDLDGRNVQLNPKALGTVRFRGAVRGLIAQNVQVFDVDVDYWPVWNCEFFHLLDCSFGPWRIASVKLHTDGRFSTILPDFARDARIGSFTDPGEFTFHIRDQKTGNPLFELKPAGSHSPVGKVAVATAYPGEQVFDAELPR
jgi:hypothetical protein